MRRRMLVLAAVVAAALAVPTIPSGAQEGTPTLAEATARYVPAPEALGEGWAVADRFDPVPTPTLFREGVKVVYAGPAGARAVLFAWVTREDAAAARGAWEATGVLLDRYRGEIAADLSFATTERLGTLDPPPGCVEARRAEGASGVFGFPAGLTLCAVEPDVVLLAVVSGQLAGERGYRAADALIAAALASAGAGDGTPTASPTAPG